MSYGDINGDNISDILTFRDGRAYGFYGSTDTSGIINYILNTVPGINSNNVNRSTDVSIVFNRDMNSSSLNSSNIKVYAEYSGIQNAILTYDSLLKKLTIDPFEDFIAGEKINVTFTSGVKTFENMNVSPFSFSFTTEATGGSARFAITDSIEITGSVNIADIDSDGDIDILVGNNTLNSMQQVKIYKNDGSGHFSYFTDVQGAYQSFTVADFDTDGDPDILSEAENDQVRLFLNDGLGNFSPSIV
ncbi:MAG: FG-GAP-like repeat-containing protein, partial [Ignavibacteria bacterium]